MPVYDFECSECGFVTEKIMTIKESDELGFDCKECGGDMNKIISASGQYCGNDDASWLKSVTDVVDPSTGHAAAQFYGNPTRSNYKSWMKESGIRPMENGERMKPRSINMDKAHDEVMRKHHQRMTDSEYRRRSERIEKRGHHN